MEKAEVIRRGAPPVTTYMIDLTCKDMRSLRFGFASQEMCKRAHTCLDLYVFPNKEDYVCASPPSLISASHQSFLGFQ